ncbi:MAG: EF-hand domain-containing protein [Chitinophagales bacterium]
MTTTERKQSFRAIDKDNSGIINFNELHKHFKALIKETNMDADELKMMFSAYDEAGSYRGVDFGEYTSFMNDVFGEAASAASTDGREEAFAAIDKDGSGVINFKEWYKHFKALVKETNMDAQELEMMFHAYDEAGSSRGVDLAEYTSFMNDVFGEVVSTTSAGGREEAFAAIDKDGSGVINFKEWYKHFKALVKETNMDAQELEMMFHAYDEAGSSRGVDLAEYTSFMNDVFGEVISTASTDGRKQAFAAIDKSGNGVINFDEWHKHFKALVKETNMDADELKMMFNAYDEAGSSRGVDLAEYTSFMNDVFGEVA